MSAPRRQVLVAGLLGPLLGCLTTACGSEADDAFPAPTGAMSPGAELAERTTDFGALSLRLPQGWTVSTDASSAGGQADGWQATARLGSDVVAAVSAPLTTTFPAQARQAGASLLAWRVTGYTETGATTTEAGAIRLSFTSAAPGESAGPSASAGPASSQPGWAWIVPLTDAAAAATASPSVGPSSPSAGSSAPASSAASPSPGASAPAAGSWVVMVLLAGSVAEALA